MLPSSLLRARVRKGKIYPIFADSSDAELASLLIEKFKYAVEHRHTRGLLADSVKELEYYYDYRLVRGLYTLLERLSIFKSKADEYCIDPRLLRRKVFEESSRRGFALTEYERSMILSDVAEAFKVNPKMLEDLLMSDIDDNMIIVELKPVSIDRLIALYNLSILQSLLFRCISLECKVSTGAEWKHILRDVKRLGLIYTLEYNDGIRCIIDGPLSLFKMTEKYGTSIARLVPKIVSAQEWYIKAWIVGSSKAKTYEFNLSSKDGIMLDKGYADELYDSSIEERFANTFMNHNTGWRLVREPEPIVVSDKAFIPDFAFEKGNIRVYLEIVGFWTKEYIERKLWKIRQLKVERSDIDIIIAVDKELECSKHSTLQSMNVILYDGKQGVPVIPILNYLRSIEDRLMHASDDAIDEVIKMIRLSLPIIDVSVIASKYNLKPDLLLSRLNANAYADRYARVGRYLISSKLLDSISDSLQAVGSKRFLDICSLLKEYGIPEECYVEVLNLLGYDVVWSSIDMSSAVVVRRVG